MKAPTGLVRPGSNGGEWPNGPTRCFVDIELPHQSCAVRLSGFYTHGECMLQLELSPLCKINLSCPRGLPANLLLAYL